MIERAEIYRCRPPEEIFVPILVLLAEVEDRVPGDADIAQAVRGLQEERSGGP